MRKGTTRDGVVDYAAVGATQAVDLMQYPPERSLPAESSWRIGSGEERFRAAGDALLSWQALRDAGLTVKDVTPAAGPTYAGVSFDENRQPIAPSRLEADQRFDADGTPWVAAGASVRLHGRVDGMNADGHLRVIFVTEEPRRVGFVLGTLGESVVSGEESFLIEWLPNDEVWFSVRAFDSPPALSYRALRTLVRRRRRALFTRYLRAVSPMFTTPA